MLAKISDLWGGSGARGGSDEPRPAGPPAQPQPGTRGAGGRSNRRIALRVAAACVSAVAGEGGKRDR